MQEREVKQKRNYFRLEYFKPDRPSLTITGKTFAVIDLSEKGIKFELPPGLKPRIKARVSGTVQLPDKSRYEIMGYVLRVDPTARICVLYLEEGLPLAKMLQEQRRLIQKYKK